MNYSLTNIVLYVLIIGIPLIAQIQITSNYNKYKKINNKKKITGFDVARKILDANGLQNVYVVEVAGNLTDHYDPSRKTVRLSSDIFHGDSIASAAVAAHECGHAIQDKENYVPMRIRSLLVPVVNLCSKASWVVIMIGFLTSYFKVFLFGIGLIGASLIFQVVTLPVEFNASSRAKKQITALKLLDDDDKDGASKMLWAAAMTYVASVLTSILEIVRLLLAFNNDRR